MVSGYRSAVSLTSSIQEADLASSPKGEDPSTLLRPGKRKLDQTNMQDNPATPASSLSYESSSYEDLEASMSFHEIDLLIQQMDDQDADDSEQEDEGSLALYWSRYHDGRAFLRIAQLLADQIIMQSHPNKVLLADGIMNLPCRLADTAGLSRDLVSPDLSSILPGIMQCDLRQLSSMGQTTSAHQMDAKNTSVPQDAAKRPLPRQANGVNEKSDRIFSIQSPMVCVCRGDAAVDLATPALRFWEELSLAPISGHKDVTAVCVLPASSLIQERVTSFMSAISGAYRSLNLGMHHPCQDIGGLENGLVTLATGAGDLDKAYQELSEACARIGKFAEYHNIYGSLTVPSPGRELGKSKTSSRTFVVYIINAFNDSTAVPRLCEAFLRLFDQYAASLGERAPDANDVVLQIIPMSLIASTEALVIPDPIEYKKLAFEVYDRCAPNPQSDHTGLTQFSYASAVHLAKAIPRSLNFQLTAQPIDGSPLSDRCIHVSYCFSITSPWLTASWTDNVGCLQWNASYYVSTDTDESWPTFAEAAQDIWEATLDIARALSNTCRLFVARIGSMPKEEYDGKI